jgi:hypothetical protein
VLDFFEHGGVERNGTHEPINIRREHGFGTTEQAAYRGLALWLVKSAPL